MQPKRFLLLVLFVVSHASAANTDLPAQTWRARWVWADGTDPFGYGVYHFRRTVELPAKPSSFLIHVTADNRYQLFVNGERVVWGPARGDLYHWRYESVDIAPQLQAGRNVLAAVVWNDGEHRAVAQISHRTAFLVQGDTEAEAAVNTGRDWVALRDESYQPLPVTSAQVGGYVAIPPGEEVDASRYPWGWERPDFDDTSWQPAVQGPAGAPRTSVDASSRWMLVPRPIPLMEETPIRLTRVRRADGIEPPAGFLQEPVNWEIPARTRVQLLLDQNELTTGYPELLVSGGGGARVTLRYAEALWIPGENQKGHRDQVEGREFKGYQDVFVADGGPGRLWRPLFWRTWRYIELTVETADAPLTVADLRAVYTGYPFERKASFDAASGELDTILDVGWRTARLCAHESYMDCPYYEQLQYVGDTRIQALVSLYTTGDARLMRNAIEQIDSSRTPEGATYSRAPSALQQYIPPFSLWWIGMVHDYWLYVDDPEFVRQMLPGVRAVLSYYGSYQRQTGTLRVMPWWNYVDWVDAWRRGTPPSTEDGMTAAIELQLLLAYGWASEMEAALGIREMASVYSKQAEQLTATIRGRYWNQNRGLLADTPAQADFSQHANSLAVLAGVISGDDARGLMERTVADDTLAPASIYFRYYLHRAMVEAGLGDRYLSMLGPWRRMLADGLTTWAERDLRSRSDCHAWGASPNVELFRTVLGIDSAGPGFARVMIRPHLGELKQASGRIPHPQGEVAVRLELVGEDLNAEIDLPGAVPGEFEWRGVRRLLEPGGNTLRIRADQE